MLYGDMREGHHVRLVLTLWVFLTLPQPNHRAMLNQLKAMGLEKLDTEDKQGLYGLKARHQKTKTVKLMSTTLTRICLLMRWREKHKTVA